MSSPASGSKVLRGVEDIGVLEADWERLASQSPWFVPLFSDLRREAEADPGSVCLAVESGATAVEGIACFRRGSHRQRFAIGERQVCEIRADAWVMQHGWLAGTLSEAAWREAFAGLRRRDPYDLLILGEVPAGSTLAQAVGRCRWPQIPLGLKDRPAVHWHIELPGTFEDYLGILRTSTRQSLRRKINRFEHEAEGRLEVISRPDQVDRFLTEGEAISRKTYQWDVGQRLEANVATRDSYLRLAEEGRLRCYLLHAHGSPIAFLRGELARSVYRYDTPGFLPAFERLSPGLVLLAYAIRDLAENTSCTIFDFGEGGDQVGYKSRFGTHSINCLNISIADGSTSRGIAVWALANTFRLLKSAGRAALGEGELKRRLKRAIRRYDDPDVTRQG